MLKEEVLTLPLTLFEPACDGQDWGLEREIDPASAAHDGLVGMLCLHGLKTSQEAA